MHYTCTNVYFRGRVYFVGVLWYEIYVSYASRNFVYTVPQGNQSEHQFIIRATGSNLKCSQSITLILQLAKKAEFNFIQLNMGGVGHCQPHQRMTIKKMVTMHFKLISEQTARQFEPLVRWPAELAGGWTPQCDPCTATAILWKIFWDLASKHTISLSCIGS